MTGAHSIAPLIPRRGVRQGWWPAAAWIVASLAAGWVGSLATDPESTWYRTLDKPSWNPPSWVFGPVWTTLYVLMGVAAWRVWRSRQDDVAVRVFAIHLFVNAAWSLLFFGARRPDLALADMVVLWAAIVWLMWRFAAVDRVAAVLLTPYLAWVSFAAALNLAIVRLNA